MNKFIQKGRSFKWRLRPCFTLFRKKLQFSSEIMQYQKKVRQKKCNKHLEHRQKKCIIINEMEIICYIWSDVYGTLCNAKVSPVETT